MDRTIWKAYQAFQNNGPNYWIVTDKAFGGTVLAKCDTEEAAMQIVRAVNSHEELVKIVQHYLFLQCREYDDSIWRKANEQAEQAIAKAEGHIDDTAEGK